MNCSTQLSRLRLMSLFEIPFGVNCLKAMMTASFMNTAGKFMNSYIQRILRYKDNTKPYSKSKDVEKPMKLIENESVGLINYYIYF